jgi:two-component system response regulator
MVQEGPLERVEGAPPVLLVEDNVDDERLTLRAGKKMGVDSFIVARTGDEALRELIEQGDGRALGLVLLDLKLPKVSGLEVLERLREHAGTRTVPVVVFTSSDEEGDILRSYELGANSFVRKPVDYDHFMEAIQGVLSYWLGLNRTPPAA